MTSSVPTVRPRFRVGDKVWWRGQTAIIHQVPHDELFDHRSDYELITDADNDMVVCSREMLQRYNRP